MAEGRLADPDCSMGTDPRSDPRMVKALAQFGLDANMPVVPLTIDAPLEEIKLHVKNNLARYKVPRDVVFIDELPHNATGKLLRRVLTEMDVDS